MGLIVSWNPNKRDESLAQALAVGRVQKKLGLRVNVNANACLYSFCDGTPETSHLDEDGNPLPFKVGNTFFQVIPLQEDHWIDIVVQ